jgi:hypothetical protein
MTAAEALEAAVVAGFAIAVDCNDLVLEATSTPPAQVVDALLRQKVEVLALLRLEQSWSAPLDQPCPARRGRVEEQPNVQHFCAECGRWAAFGFGVSLRKGQLGRWYCAEHRPDRSGICAGTQCRGDQVPAVDVREQGTSPRGQLKLLQPANQNWTAEDWQRRFNERAAIAEQQQGMCRAEAERWAVECCVTEWLNGNPHPSPADYARGAGVGTYRGPLFCLSDVNRRHTLGSPDMLAGLASSAEKRGHCRAFIDGDSTSE